MNIHIKQMSDLMPSPPSLQNHSTGELWQFDIEVISSYAYMKKIPNIQNIYRVTFPLVFALFFSFLSYLHLN